ncbi:MAG: TonB-dependent receptor [Bacteroidetes bacterium]|nr:MAG: TonB-dependent receptor [Bacteroidota bacterium]
MKRKLNFKLSLVLFQLFFGLTSDADAQDTLVKNLDEITITATKTEKNILDVGRSVTVLTADDILKSNYLSLAELLSQESGLYIPGTGQTPGSNQSIFLQGANSNQTAIFIDGIRITDVSTVNNVIDLSELSLNEIERIEILRGSHSTLYGSSAIGGVINISTKKPKGRGLYSNGGLSVGNFGTGTSILNPFTSIGYMFTNGIYLSGTAEYNQVNGLDATIDTVTDPSVYKNRDKDDWEKINTGISFGYIKAKTKLNFEYRHSSSETDIDKSAFVDDDNYVLDFRRNVLSTSISQNLNESTRLKLTGGFSKNTRHAVNDSSIVSIDQSYDRQFTEDTYSGSNGNLDLIVEHSFRHLNVLAGLSGSNEAMESENYVYSATFAPFIYESHTSLKDPAPQTNTRSVYLQADVKGDWISANFSKLNFIAGIRYDVHSLFKEQVSFQLNPSWKLGKNSLLYFSYSTGYNSPSLYQLYANSGYTPWDGSAGLQLTLGNPMLRPEKSKSSELGIKYNVTSKLYFSFSAYHRVSSNNIEYVYLWNKSTPLAQLGSDFSRDDFRGDRYINAGSVNFSGVEINFDYRIFKNLKLGLNLSYGLGELKIKHSQENDLLLSQSHVQLYNNGHFLGTENYTQKGLTRRPTTASLDCQYTGIKKVQTALVLRFIDSRDDVYYDTQIKPQGALNTVSIDSYFLLDLNISYQMTKHLILSSRAENILDSGYSEIRGFSTRGRGVYLKFTYQL